MADWRQIQARIRKAKNSPDAPAKLNELFQRTRDGMVAWELGVVEEKAEHREQAGHWYTIAAQRFRRADWRKKAEEALTRLGMEIPAPAAPVEHATPAAAEAAVDTHNRIEMEESGEEADEVDGNRMPMALGEIPESHEEDDEEEVTEKASGAPGAAAEGSGPGGKRKRRRGRRGGRGRRRKGVAPSSGLPSQAFAPAGTPADEAQQARPAVPHVVAPAYERPAPERAAAPEPVAAAAPRERASRAEIAAPQLPSERAAHGRGDPALASRMAHLESLLRRLVQSPLHRLDECDDAPAGPGVFLLSESDQITSYYVEACQTLRIGAGNLARGGRSGNRGSRGHSGEPGLKARLAEYLGISDAKVAQYMKDHCVLRWIQLDDEAPMLAHFAIGVLRTPLNLD